MQVDNDLIKSIKITPLLDTLRLEDISDEVYFSEKYSNYISNSRLGLLKSKGVIAFFEGFKDDGSFNSSFSFGDMLHKLVLQKDSYELIDSVFKPTAKAGLVADYLYKNDGSPVSDDDIKIASIKCNYYKNQLTKNRLIDFKTRAEPYWRDRFLYEQKHPPVEGINRIYTDEKSVSLLKSCLHSLKKDKKIQKLLHPVKDELDEIYFDNERTILLDIEANVPGYDEPRIFKLKSKLDNFIIDSTNNTITVNDLKTTSRLARDFDPEYFSYQRELGMYSVLLKYCSEKFFNLSNPTIKGNFLVVSTALGFYTSVYPMTEDLFRRGVAEFMYLLKVAIYLNVVKGYEFTN